MAWSDFVALAEQDGAENNDRGMHARNALASLGHYMLARFGTQDVSLLGALIADGGVITAINANLVAVQAAEQAVTDAAEAVINPVVVEEM